jgi:hypothetical protein
VQTGIVARSPDKNPNCGALLTDLYELTKRQGVFILIMRVYVFDKAATLTVVVHSLLRPIRV